MGYFPTKRNKKNTRRKVQMPAAGGKHANLPRGKKRKKK